MPLTPEAGERKWLRNWPSWVVACTEKHLGKYTYPSSQRVEDEHGRWKIAIVCKDHGEFWQAPEKHKFGRGCPQCAGSELPRNAIGVLEDAYPESDFKQASVVSSKGKLKLVCKIHGVFETSFNKLMTKHGLRPGTPACPECARSRGGENRRKSTDEWKADLGAAFLGRGYEFDFTTLVKGTQKMRVVCPDHGEFWAPPNDMYAGKNGCPLCAKTARFDYGQSRRLDPEEFVISAFTANQGKYIYDFKSFTGGACITNVICLKHGLFQQRANNHRRLGAGCPKCANSVSKGETEVADFITSEGFEIEVRDRAILGGLEIDIWIPSIKLGIEYCGLYWHGENHKSSDYHEGKLKLANDAGIRLLQMFEDEWLYKKEAVKLRIKHMLGVSSRVFARNLELVSVQWSEARVFYGVYHTQGAGTPTSNNYGLRSNGVLVACMSFGPSRFGTDTEMFRYATVLSVVGGFSRLLKAFLRNNKATDKVVSYSDNRWSSGGAYAKNGFTLDGRSRPGYAWCKGTKRINRFNMQKHKLKDIMDKFDPDKSEVDNCLANGYWRIFDCGTTKWVYRRSA